MLVFQGDVYVNRITFEGILLSRAGLRGMTFGCGQNYLCLYDISYRSLAVIWKIKQGWALFTFVLYCIVSV
jgi:hypothetical protein